MGIVKREDTYHNVCNSVNYVALYFSCGHSNFMGSNRCGQTYLDVQNATVT
jgi:hypothetical protein